MGTLLDRLAENEVIFRKYNESVEKGYDNLKKVAKDQQWQEPVEVRDDELHFFCECSDENCHERVLLKLSKYSEIHQDRSQFVVICGHEVPATEEVVANEKEYCVIRKYKTPPESAEHLHNTPIDNR